MSQERYTRWINSTLHLAAVEPFLMIYVQQLGRLDCQLINEDEWVVRCQIATEQDGIRLNEQLAMSQLWVLGIYEVVRTLHQRLAGHALEKDAQKLKQRINQLRVPLAKLEAAGSRSGDTHLAYPVINTAHGVAWQLTENDVITRRELSDLALDFFERFTADSRAKAAANSALNS